MACPGHAGVKGRRNGMSAPGKGEEGVPTGVAFRHLLAFQFKLAMDALRDFALSPLSIAAFVMDAILRPPEGKSLYQRLMKLGRRSDRVINLFDEYTDSGYYTVDETLSEVEQALWREFQKERRSRSDGDALAAGEDDTHAQSR
jgi:hypothetical protein